MCEICGRDDSECYPTGKKLDYVLFPRLEKKIDSLILGMLSPSTDVPKEALLKLRELRLKRLQEEYDG